MQPQDVATPSDQRKDRRNQKLIVLGVILGVAYGLALRLAAGFLSAHNVMTVGFIVFMPFALGFVAVFVAEMKEKQRIWIWFVLPWLPLAAAMVGMILALLEGLICIVMFLPVGMVLSSLGGLVAGMTGRFLRSQSSRRLTVGCVVILPFLVTPWETRVLYQLETRTVENVVDIHAPAEVVWRNIERVPPIAREELPSSWSRAIGFPDPVEATLSHEGIGGVRQASFRGGLLFTETVDTWEPQHRLAFNIRADAIPKTVLDEHVTVGGPYFDVMRGEYRLEPLANGVIRLHLSSRHRLSTDFNWYAHLWTDAAMSDLQNNILHVIRRRCESDGELKHKAE